MLLTFAYFWVANKSTSRISNIAKASTLFKTKNISLDEQLFETNELSHNTLDVMFYLKKYPTTYKNPYWL